MRSSAPTALRRLQAWLPDGQSLPVPVWRRRHRGMVWLLWANVPALFVFALVDGYPPVHALVDVAPVVALGLLAIPASFPRRGREAAVTIGLLTCSAVLVHLWHGTTEAHFHYFVIVCVLALYEEWFPYLLALAYVVLQHGLMGTMDPDSVYGHAAGGLQSPWVWAAIHGGFIGAMSVASIVSWRLNEHVREQLRHNQLRLRFQADHDALTELPNRGRFEQRLGEALGRSTETGRGVAVIFADVDNFKVINDSLGHQSGDELLQAVAAAADRVLRPDDVSPGSAATSWRSCSRPSTTRPGPAPSPGAASVLRRRSCSVVAPVPHRELRRRGHRRRGTDPADLPRRRRRHVPGQGARQVALEVFDESMHARGLERLEIENGLRDALERGQAASCATSPRCRCGPARPSRRRRCCAGTIQTSASIAPGRFVPIAEQSGLIVAIGAWVLREACDQAVAWTRSTGTQVMVAVNLSPRQLGATISAPSCGASCATPGCRRTGSASRSPRAR